MATSRLVELIDDIFKIRGTCDANDIVGERLSVLHYCAYVTHALREQLILRPDLFHRVESSARKFQFSILPLLDFYDYSRHVPNEVDTSIPMLLIGLFEGPGSSVRFWCCLLRLARAALSARIGYEAFVESGRRIRFEGGTLANPGSSQ